MAITTRRARLASEQGAELIEFAMVAPILIFMFAALVDFGMMFRAFEAVTNAAREGARVGVLRNYQDVDVQTRVNQYLAAAGLSGTPTITVQDVPMATAAGTFMARSVLVSYPYQFAVLGPVATLFGGNFGTIPLRAAAVMRREAAAAAP